MQKKPRATFLTVTLLLLMVSCGKPDLSTTKGKYSYALGHQISNNLKRQKIDVDVESFSLALSDIIKGNESKLTREEMRNAVQKMTQSIQNAGKSNQVSEKKESGLYSTRGKYSYAIGQQITKNIMRQGIEIDAKAFSLALEDVISGKKSKLTIDEMKNAMKEMAAAIQQRGQDPQEAEKNKKEGEEYLTKNRNKSGVIVTASGLQYKVLKRGNGPRPKISDKVKVNYRGTLINGSEFDSSYKRKKPAEFAVNRLIPGWTEALQLMNVGSKYQLTIPSNLAYGSRSNPGIPANSVLIFELELLGIVK